jgi:glucose/arabinose dehydrogenase
MSVILLVTGLLGASAAYADDLQLGTVRVASGLFRPVYVTSPPGDTARIFIVEQHTGNIKIVKNGTLLGQPFMTQTGLTTGNEQGLLGLAFHPEYPDSPYFYINYTRANGATVIKRYTVSGANADSADTTTGMTILTFPQPQTNHNGGWVAFGPDGYLYIGSGDGGGANDQGTGHDPVVGNGQSNTTLLGKMLRIDVDDHADSSYAIPPDNPFIGQPGRKWEIWAKGLRNPWRNAFDRATGDLYIADVGQDVWEEINMTPASDLDSRIRNYGWRLFEGNVQFNCPAPCSTSGLIFPFWVYSHGGSPFRCSVTGGYVYRGSAIPQLQGQYIYADYCSDQIWTTQVVNGLASDPVDRTADLAPGGGMVIADITSFGEDANGEIYICDQGVPSNGEVYKIVSQASTGVGTGYGSGIFLGSAMPNPSRDGFAFRVALPAEGKMSLDVFDTSGRLVRTLVDGVQPSGTRDLAWDARDQRGRPVPGGVYLIRLQSGDQSAAQKVSVVR